MITFKDYFEILEELRKDNHLTVSELCHGIVSERTYYRYLNSNLEIKFNIYSKLVDRLGIEFEQILIYSIHFKKSDPSIIKFVYRVHVNHFTDIKPLYDIVLQHEPSDTSFGHVVKAMLYKYEFLIGTLDQKAYQIKLEDLIGMVLNDENLDIYKATLLTIYLETNPQNELIDIKRLYAFLLNNDFRMSPLFSVMAVDTFLITNLRSNLINHEEFKTLAMRFKEHLYFFGLKSFKMNLVLYLAYTYKMDHHTELMNQYLMKYVMNLSILHGKRYYDQHVKLVESLFEIDITSFIPKQLNLLFESKQLKLKT